MPRCKQQHLHLTFHPGYRVEEQVHGECLVGARVDGVLVQVAEEPHHHVARQPRQRLEAHVQRVHTTRLAALRRPHRVRVWLCAPGMQQQQQWAPGARTQQRAASVALRHCNGFHHSSAPMQLQSHCCHPCGGNGGRRSGRSPSTTSRCGSPSDSLTESWIAATTSGLARAIWAAASSRQQASTRLRHAIAACAAAAQGLRSTC